MLFPPSPSSYDPITRLVIDDDGPLDRMPTVQWAGAADADPRGGAGVTALLGERRGAPLLVEHAHHRFERPGLRGHRLADPRGGARDVAGRAWTTSFRQGEMQ